MTVQQWSTTPSSNNAAPPTGAPEGQTPGSVNNVIREMMASVAVEAQVNRVKYVNSAAGTNTITGSLTPALPAYSAGMILVITPANNNTAATTLAIDGLTALDVQKADGDALVSGDLVAGIPAVLVLDSGADDWILLNPQTINATAVTATNAVTGGSLSIGGAATINGSLTTDNTTADEVGYKGLPQNSQSGNYTCVLTDNAKHIEYTGSGGQTLTIPANASVAYPSGTVLTFVHFGGASAITIAITSDTLLLAGAGSTGSRTLAQNGIASAMKITATQWLISGAGLS